MEFDTNSLFYSYLLQSVRCDRLHYFKKEYNLGLQPTYIAQKTELI